MSDNKEITKYAVLFVGSFPPEGKKIFGGNVTDCKILLASSMPERVELTLLDSAQISNPPPSFFIRMMNAIKRFFKFLYLFESNHFDAVLLFSSAGASFLEKSSMAWYAKLRSTPALLFPRGGRLIDKCIQSSYSLFWVRCSSRGAKKFLCQGSTWQRFAVGYLGFSEDNAPVIHSWAAKPSLLAIGENRRFNPDKQVIQLIFVGWLERNKGIFELLDACNALQKSNRSFVLHIAGEGHASDEVRQKVNSLNLEDNVRFHGWLESGELEGLLAISDVFVLPSWAEGLPNSMIEAMAAKLPVIVSAVGNIPDLLSDGKEALLIPAKNSAALYDALVRVIDDPALCQELAENAYQHACHTWGVEKAVDALVLAIHKSIVSNN